MPQHISKKKATQIIFPHNLGFKIDWVRMYKTRH